MSKSDYLTAQDITNSHGVTLPSPTELERGGIVGKVTVVDCVTEHTSPYLFGKYGFVLPDAAPLPFRPYLGRLSFSP